MTAAVNFGQAELNKETTDYVSYLNNMLKIEYHSIDKKFTEIDESNRPYVKCIEPCKDLEVTYFLHGFMGTPYEMKFISEAALKKGNTVFNDLIFGYGHNSLLTNKVKKEMYVKNVERNLTFLFKHYQKVNLVGFSTGGLLITNFIEEHPEWQQKIGNVQLVSPYYFPYISIAPTFGKILRLFIENVPVSTFYKISSFPDVEVILLEKNNYLQSVPVNAAVEIDTLAKLFQEKATPKENLKNIDIYLTENDQVLSFKKCHEFLARIYPNARFHLYNGKRMPHHLMSPAVSNVALEIKNNIEKI